MADDYDDEGDILDLDDELDEAMGDCHSFLENGVIVCGALGSEHCDFECPFRNDLGLTPAEAEDRAVNEVLADVQARREAKGSAEYDSWGATPDSTVRPK
jgi:hypothetical protein